MLGIMIGFGVFAPLYLNISVCVCVCIREETRKRLELIVFNFLPFALLCCCPCVMRVMGILMLFLQRRQRKACRLGNHYVDDYPPKVSRYFFLKV